MDDHLMPSTTREIIFPATVRSPQLDHYYPQMTNNRYSKAEIQSFLIKYFGSEDQHTIFKLQMIGAAFLAGFLYLHFLFLADSKTAIYVWLGFSIPACGFLLVAVFKELWKKIFTKKSRRLKQACLELENNRIANKGLRWEAEKYALFLQLDYKNENEDQSKETSVNFEMQKYHKFEMVAQIEKITENRLTSEELNKFLTGFEEVMQTNEKLLVLRIFTIALIFILSIILFRIFILDSFLTLKDDHQAYVALAIGVIFMILMKLVSLSFAQHSFSIKFREFYEDKKTTYLRQGLLWTFNNYITGAGTSKFQLTLWQLYKYFNIEEIEQEKDEDEDDFVFKKKLR